MAFELQTGQRAERKQLITVAEWTEGTTVVRQILGTRTPDSSIDYNPEIETSTDILGYSYTDVNKTEPEQAFDPHLILGGAKLAEKIDDIRRRNALNELNQFTVYVITAYKKGTVGTTEGYQTEKQTDCTITYESLGGESNVNFPITVHFSNKTTLGIVDKLSDDFVFTPETTTQNQQSEL